MQVGEESVHTKSAIKYLGILMDTKLTFWPQIKRVAEKAAAITAAHSRIMANTSGPKPSKRRLLMSVTHSILLYGAEIWAHVLLSLIHISCHILCFPFFVN